MRRDEYLRHMQWDAFGMFTDHALLEEHYWSDGKGARWVVGRPGTFMFRCEIIAGIGGSLIVHGDFDLCRFAHYGDRSDAWSRLLWMADHTSVDYYVTQKAAIGLRARDAQEYSPEVAQTTLRERTAEARAEGDQELAVVLDEALDCTESVERLSEFLYENASQWDAWEWEVGRVTSWLVVVSHVALNRCAWLLRERWGPDGPPACSATVTEAS